MAKYPPACRHFQARNVRWESRKRTSRKHQSAQLVPPPGHGGLGAIRASGEINLWPVHGRAVMGFLVSMLILYMEDISMTYIIRLNNMVDTASYSCGGVSAVREGSTCAKLRDRICHPDDLD